ncbi:conjugal transfer protein TraG N-terminal domain-containing protein [Parvularcula oceani]|uniref:conjugal transfer protein TraG N-terminal domain-containing protein n=1 Tax=Parvularcula oceani TaxID=1247963 RepID=UPI0004E1D57B|nr:conjugal transfer protein TraG N-terminal domain-containing protein [Parvularcula oceani]
MEVITYGGGEFIRDMFNAVAALVGLGAFASAIRLSLLLGLLYALFLTAFSMNFMTTIRWFVATLLIYLCLLVPKTDVQIVDRFDLGLPGANVGGVPIGLALIASFTTTVGDKFTELTEDTFSLPTDLEYQENGFIYGSKIFKDAMSFQVTDAVFAENLSGFIRTCVFYDLLEHRYSVTELRETGDLWAMLTVTYPPNPARFYEWVNGGGATVVKSCDQAAIDLDAQWTAEVNRVAQIYGKQIAPELTEAAAQALVLGNLAEAHDFFLGSARAASDQIRQVTIANMIDKAVRDQGAELGADALLDAYGQARMESEMNHAIGQGSRLAERFVPLFRTVAEALFYGLFPILFPLFLLPESGMRLLRGYTGGFVTLMAWGPIYVILHRIMMGTAGSRSLGAAYTPTSGEAITLVTQTGIEAVHADIAMIAGYMTLMVPFAAAALGRGAMAFTGLSQSFLHPAQTAAQGAAREVSTGNVSLGNTSFDTHRFASVDGNRTATSSFVDTGEGSWNTPEGGRMRAAASGARIYDGMGAISRGGTHVDYQGGLQTALQSEASWSLERRDAAAQRSSESRTALAHDISDLTWQVSQGRSIEETSGYSLDTRQSESVNKLVQNASRFAERHSEGREREFAMQAYVAASVGAKAEIPFIGPKANIEGGARAHAAWQARASEIYEAARDASRTDGTQETFDDVVATFDRASASESGGENHSWRKAFAANLQESRTASRDLESYQARHDAARELASQVTREGSGFTANWDNAFLAHMAGQDRGDGHAVGMNEAARRWTSGELADRMWVEAEAREFIGAQASELLETPGLDGFRRPTAPEVGPDGFAQVQTVGDGYQQRAEALSEGVAFDGGRHEQIEGTQAWTGNRHEVAVAKSTGNAEELAQLRKFTVQARVQDGRDAEWDAFARSEPDEMPEKHGEIWRKAKRLPGIGGAPANGDWQRRTEDRMPDEQPLANDDHYQTGADRLETQ